MINRLLELAIWSHIINIDEIMLCRIKNQRLIVKLKS